MGRRRDTGVKGFITEDLKKQVNALGDDFEVGHVD